MPPAIGKGVQRTGVFLHDSRMRDVHDALVLEDSLESLLDEDDDEDEDEDDDHLEDSSDGRRRSGFGLAVLAIVVVAVLLLLLLLLFKRWTACAQERCNTMLLSTGFDDDNGVDVPLIILPIQYSYCSILSQLLQVGVQSS